MRRLTIAFVALVLVLGSRVTLAAEEESPAAGSFGPTGSLAEARAMHTATALPDGRVLVVGGIDLVPRRGGGPVSPPPIELRSSAEVWDPATGTFAPTGPLGVPRADHTTTALPGGRVLVVGGSGGGLALASAEVWDPTTEAFRATGSLATGRVKHRATLLPDGRVLVVGGTRGGKVLASAEVWDPATEAFSATGSLAVPRMDHTATLLADGRVLVIGGYDGDGALGYLASVEVWDPTTQMFGPAGSLADWRSGHHAVLLPDGRVLVVGGVTMSTDAEVFDPVTGRSIPAAPRTSERQAHTATALADGRVLVVGGLVGGPSGYGVTGEAEVWDPATGTFGPAGALDEARTHDAATLLPDGRVLVVGGSGEDVIGGEGDDWLLAPALASAEVWEPHTSAAGHP